MVWEKGSCVGRKLILNTATGVGRKQCYMATAQLDTYLVGDVAFWLNVVGVEAPRMACLENMPYYDDPFTITHEQAANHRPMFRWVGLNMKFIQQSRMSERLQKALEDPYAFLEPTLEVVISVDAMCKAFGCISHFQLINNCGLSGNDLRYIQYDATRDYVIFNAYTQEFEIRKGLLCSNLNYIQNASFKARLFALRPQSPYDRDASREYDLDGMFGPVRYDILSQYPQLIEKMLEDLLRRSSDKYIELTVDIAAVLQPLIFKYYLAVALRSLNRLRFLIGIKRGSDFDRLNDIPTQANALWPVVGINLYGTPSVLPELRIDSTFLAIFVNDWRHFHNYQFGVQVQLGDTHLASDVSVLSQYLRQVQGSQPPLRISLDPYVASHPMTLGALYNFRIPIIIHTFQLATFPDNVSNRMAEVKRDLRFPCLFIRSNPDVWQQVPTKYTPPHQDIDKFAFGPTHSGFPLRLWDEELHYNMPSIPPLPTPTQIPILDPELTSDLNPGFTIEYEPETKPQTTPQINTTTLPQTAPSLLSLPEVDSAQFWPLEDDLIPDPIPNPTPFIPSMNPTPIPLQDDTVAPIPSGIAVEDDASTCCVCTDAEASHAFFPCMHQCICADCFAIYNPPKPTCPVCREPYLGCARVHKV